MNPQETGLSVIPETKAVTKFSAEHGQEVGLPSPEAVNYMMSVAKLITSTALIGNDMGADQQPEGRVAPIWIFAEGDLRAEPGGNQGECLRQDDRRA